MSAVRPEADGPRPGWVALALVAAVLATYQGVGALGFVDYDDPDYVLANPAVRGGLTWPGLRWALGAAHASNWHPLTWLAHMLDVELFGLEPAGHHWMALALHALASVLCFVALRRLTRAGWESAGVAFLFALHPLRVESVAWISERKDLLAGCAFFALLWAYAGYARAGGARRYALVVLFLALGLLAKPMLVTAPCVLLLLDWWPLRRLPDGRSTTPARAQERHASPGPPRVHRVWLEKLPLLLLAGLVSAAALWSQRAGGSLYTLEALPLAERLANAPLAILRYLAHFFWPHELAYFYPHRALVGAGATWSISALLALGAVLVLCALALLALRTRPALGVGWWWFVGMLLPVLGLVQVGEQALADRYAYLPMVGVQLALVFLLGDLVRARPRARRPLAAAAGLVLLACALASARQVRVWRDSETLYRHALAATTHNYPAWTGLANALAARGELAEARRAYEQALEIRPHYAPALYGLGLLEQQHGDAERALALYRRALLALPGFAAAELNLGSLLAARGERVEAAQAFEHVLELYPEHPDAHFNLALLLLLSGRPEAAEEELRATLRARGEHAPAWEKLGELLEARGEHRAAIEALERALRDPSRLSAARTLAWILASAAEPELRRPAQALELARRVVQASARREPAALEALAAALAANGEPGRAAEVQAEALALLPPGQQGAARARLERYSAGQSFTHEH